MTATSDTAAPRDLPLTGVTVFDLGQIYQGPYAGFLLAMAGARVIKVEQRRGEPLLARGPSLPYAMLNSSKDWRSLLEVIGRNDLLSDERLHNNSDRAEHMTEVDRLVEGWTETRLRDDVVAALQTAHVPAAAVRIVDEVVRDERQHDRGAAPSGPTTKPYTWSCWA